MRKPAFCICENKDAETAQLISAFVFAIQVVQSIYFLNTKFQASSLVVQPGLCGAWTETPKTGFLTTRLNFEAEYSNNSADEPVR